MIMQNESKENREKKGAVQEEKLSYLESFKKDFHVAVLFIAGIIHSVIDVIVGGSKEIYNLFDFKAIGKDLLDALKVILTDIPFAIIKGVFGIVFFILSMPEILFAEFKEAWDNLPKHKDFQEVFQK